MPGPPNFRRFGWVDFDSLGPALPTVDDADEIVVRRASGPNQGMSRATFIAGAGAVSSVFGRGGAVVAVEGDYSLELLSDVDLTAPAINDFGFRFDGADWVNDSSIKWDTADFRVAGDIEVLNGDGGALRNVAASLTVPSVLPIRTDTNTGLGADSGSVDRMNVVAGGIIGTQWREISNHIILFDEVHTPITASVTQTQGQIPLLSSYNEVTIVANANDVVTLPAATVGQHCTAVNSGANNLQLFPASGDDLGEGVDTSLTIAPGKSMTFLGLDTTNWIARAKGGSKSAAYTRTAAIVEDRTLLASASATTLNNNNVLAALIIDLQDAGVLA